MNKKVVRLVALIIKEFRVILRDPKSRLIIIVPPILQFFIFGYAATFDVNHISYAVLDQSHSERSRNLRAYFQGSTSFSYIGEVYSSHQAEMLFNAGKITLLIHIPNEFSRTNSSSKVMAISDGRNSNVAAISTNYAAEIVQLFSENEQIYSHRSPLPKLNSVAWYNENLQSRWFIVSALGAIISMIIVMILASLSVAREREFGTFDQLLVAPFSSLEILMGKALPALILGIAEALILAAAAVFWFGIPFRGSILALLLLLLFFVLAVVGVGLCISSFCATLQQALLGSFSFIMPTVLLSGFTTPISNMPLWLQQVTLLSPLRYAVSGLREIFLEGATLTGMSGKIVAMSIIASITLTVAGWMFQHRK